MPWTIPRSWTPGEKVTAAVMNSHLRDNLNILKTEIGDDGSIARLRPLHRNITPVGNVGVAGPDDLMTYTVPANTFVNDGDMLKVVLMFTTAANANGKQVRTLIDGTATILDGNLGGSVVHGVKHVFYLWKTGATNLRVYGHQSGGNATTPWYRANLTITFSNTFVIKGLAWDATADNDIVQELMLVYKVLL